MKKHFTTYCRLAALVTCLLSGVQAQTPYLHQCGPSYPVPDLENFLYNGEMWDNIRSGIFEDGVLRAWFVENNSARVFTLGPTGYTEISIEGSVAGANDFGHVFPYNGAIHYADPGGIRNATTGLSVTYPSADWTPYASINHDGVIWMLAGGSNYEGAMIRYDGTSVSVFPASDSSIGYAQNSAERLFSIGDDLYFNGADPNAVSGSGWILRSFNTATQTFSTFDPAVYANWSDSLVVGYFQNAEGGISVLLYSALDYYVKELTAGGWSDPIWLNDTLFNSAGGGFKSVVATGDKLLLIDDGYNTCWSYATLFIKNSGAYAAVNEFNFFGYNVGCEMSGPMPVLRRPNGNVLLLTPYAEDYISFYGCSGSFVELLIGDSMHFASGKIYVDLNQNGSFDGLDYAIPAGNACTNYYCAFINPSNGEYIVPIADNDVITPGFVPNYTVVPSSYNLVTVDSSMANLDFGLQALSPLSDLAVAYIYSQPARPGFTISQSIGISNVGTTPLVGVVSYTFDSLYSFNSAVPVPASQSGNTVTWDLGSLNPLLETQISVMLTLNASAVLGNTVSGVASVSTTGDGNSSNDSYTLEQIVQGSFDPNDKAANPPYWRQPGQNITYTIRFQNTGTDTAFNIVVRDTLDANLDWASFELHHASHGVITELDQQNGAVAFRFDNVLLPDSNVNEPASHGKIVYSIKAKNGLVDGTPILNTAHIYFDFNEAVVTNTTLNVIGEPLSVATLNADQPMLLFPNPATQTVSILYNGPGKPISYALVDVTGRTLKSGEMLNGLTTVTLDALSAGAYTAVLLDYQGNVLSRARLAVVH
ncbi:MAG TPA: hypothetical protein VEY71_05875 [Chitinophagales bacterium]|nr:hypothetical protein [Chitinophagales bacterium]